MLPEFFFVITFKENNRSEQQKNETVQEVMKKTVHFIHYKKTENLEFSLEAAVSSIEK